MPNSQVCMDTGQYNGNPWWYVDLGQATNVLGMTLWQRSDCCQSRLVGLQFFIGNSAASYSANTLCPNVNTPYPVSPWYYNISCQLTGRYVWVVSPQVSGPAGKCSQSMLHLVTLCFLLLIHAFAPDLNFCELEVWAASSCPTRSSPNAFPMAGSTCVGAGLGDRCVQTCNAGFTAVAGASNATCQGSAWDQKV